MLFDCASALPLSFVFLVCGLDWHLLGFDCFSAYAFSFWFMLAFVAVTLVCFDPIFLNVI